MIWLIIFGIPLTRMHKRYISKAHMIGGCEARDQVLFHNEGYVTVFVSLLLGAMMIFFVFGLELAHLYAGRARAAKAVTDVTRGFFGDFDPDIFERYHLLMIDETYGTGGDAYLEERLFERLDGNLNGTGATPFSYEVSEVMLSEKTYLISDECKPLKKQIHDYCAYSLLDNVVSELKKVNEEGEKEETFDPSTEEASSEEQVYEDPTPVANGLKGSALLRFVCPIGSLPSETEVELSGVASRKNAISPESSPISFDFSSEAGVSGLLSSVKLSLSGLTPPKESLELASYVRTCLSDQVNERDDTVFKAELEYLLFGRDTDSENVLNAVNDIILIRFPFNYQALKKSPGKQAMITAAATALTIATGIPIKVYKVIFNAAGAYMESVLDVRALLAGERVSLKKSSAEWRLDLTAFFKKECKEKNKSSSGKGLAYRDYLTLLLLIRPNKKAFYYRLMDLVALNTKGEGELMDIDHMITNATFSYRIELFPRFSTTLYDSDPEAYTFVFERETGY